MTKLSSNLPTWCNGISKYCHPARLAKTRISLHVAALAATAGRSGLVQVYWGPDHEPGTYWIVSVCYLFHGFIYMCTCVCVLISPRLHLLFACITTEIAPHGHIHHCIWGGLADPPHLSNTMVCGCVVNGELICVPQISGVIVAVWTGDMCTCVFYFHTEL